MNRRYIGILIIFSGLIIMAAFVYFAFFYNITSDQEAAKQGETAKESAGGSSISGESLPGSGLDQNRAIISAPSLINREEFSQEDLKRIAESFAERFGSYSNQSDYNNIRDLELFMSANMKNWAEKYIEEAINKKSQTDIYYGITTNAVSKTVQLFDEDNGMAKVLVKTQRRESTGAAVNAVNFYQDILISFVKEKGAWRVDGAYWQAK